MAERPHNVRCKVASGLLALLVLAALGAPLWGPRLLGFGYAEMDSMAVLQPPGTRSIPAEHRSYDGRRSTFLLLDRDGDGRIVCDFSGPMPDCPELDLARQHAQRLHLGWLRAGRHHRGEPGIPAGTVAGLEDLDHSKAVEAPEVVTQLAPYHFNAADLRRADTNRDGVLEGAEYPGAPVPRTHLLGTDSLGRDLAVRLLYGLQVSLLVALAAACMSFLLGALLGLASGFVGGWPDRFFMRLLEVLQAIPFLFVVILVAVFAREHLALRLANPEAKALAQSVVLFCALGAVQWFSLARYARGLGLALRTADWSQSLVAMGFGMPYVVSRHLLRNALVPLLAYALLLVPVLVLEEAFLSFLGFGVQPPFPSLGTLLADGVATMDSALLLLVAPALAILALAWSLHVVGDHLSARTLGEREARP